jgi:hypothetical protein
MKRLFVSTKPNCFNIEKIDYYNSKKEQEELIKTSEIIKNQYRFQKLEGKFRIKSIFLISCFLAISVIIIICLLQYDEYFAYINLRRSYINKTKAFCNLIEFSEIDVISTPISFLLIIMYILIYKRRVFLRNKFKYRNIGLPMIVSVWNKVNNFIFLKMIKFK